MLTHNQTIHAIVHLVPTLTKQDHGVLFWVGMPVEGNVQTGDAFIAAWNVPDVDQPTFEEIQTAWEECGDTYVDSALAPPAVVSKRAALMALYVLRGVTKNQISEAIDTIEDEGERYIAQIAWEDATEVHRNDATTQTIAAMFSFTEEDLDELFLQAREFSV